MRHRGHRNPKRKQNQSISRFLMCATVTIGTQIETRIDRPIASQCAPPWPSEPTSEPESINQSLPDVRHCGHRNPGRNQNRSPNRFSMCATVAVGTQIETRIDRPIAARCAPPWPQQPTTEPESIAQSLPNVRHHGQLNTRPHMLLPLKFRKSSIICSSVIDISRTTSYE